jgi:hypothetical protein
MARSVGRLRGAEPGIAKILAKVSRRFLKKAPQKLLLCWAKGFVGDSAHDPAYRSFFASFCSQKEAFLFACLV